VRPLICIILASFLAVSAFGYFSLRADADGADRLNHAFSLSLNHGATLPDGSCGDPALTVGFTTGHTRDKPFYGLLFSDPAELLIKGDCGLRRELRIGVAYLPVSERLGLQTQARASVWWRWCEAGFAVHSITRYQHGVRSEWFP